MILIITFAILVKVDIIDIKGAIRNEAVILVQKMKNPSFSGTESAIVLVNEKARATSKAKKEARDKAFEEAKKNGKKYKFILLECYNKLLIVIFGPFA